MNMLIGGTGFIGSVLADKLVEHKKDVISLSRTIDQKNPGIQYHAIDLQRESVPNELYDHVNDVFILIGKKKQGFDKENEKRILRDLLAPIARGKQRLFYFSSVSVYGEQSKPATEQTVHRPVDEYGLFKSEAETLIQNIVPQDRTVILRVSNVYGAPGDTGLIGNAMRKIAHPDGNPLELHGNGEFTRDHIFVDDVAEICLTIQSNPHAFGTLNIATGQSISGNQIIELIEDVTGHSVPKKRIDNKPTPKHVRISNTKLKRTHSIHSFTPLKNGLKKTFARFRSKTK